MDLAVLVQRGSSQVLALHAAPIAKETGSILMKRRVYTAKVLLLGTGQLFIEMA